MADGEHLLLVDEDAPVAEPERQTVEPQIDHVEQQLDHVKLDDSRVENQEVVEETEDLVDEEPTGQEQVAHHVEEPEEVVDQGIPCIDMPQGPMRPLFDDQPEETYYPQPEVIPPIRIDNSTLFHPAAFNPDDYEIPPPRSSEDSGEDGDGTQNGEERRKHDANEHTVWIDSEPEDNTEEEILRQNFYLPYSDHNYDCADPLDRVVHPEEGPFPVIEGLDKFGNITRQYMPGQEAGSPLEGSMSPGTSSTVLVHEQSLHQNLIQHHQPYQQRMITMHRPVGTTQPFSIGGTEYQQRVEPAQRMIRDSANNYRLVNEYGTPMGVPVRAPTQRVGPTAAILRTGRPDLQGGHQTIYQSPQQPIAIMRNSGTPLSQRRPLPQHQQTVAPAGSYQHVAQVAPGGVLRRGTVGRGMPQGVIGQRQVAVRPMQVNRQMEVLEREYDAPHLLQPAQAIVTSTPPVQRRVADVAPHRMTQEQRMEQQQQNSQRPAARFPMVDPQQHNRSPTAMATQIIPVGGGRPGPQRLLVRGQGPQPTGTGVLVRARAISGGTEELLRSPQRVPIQSPQNQLQHSQGAQGSSSPRKFHMKVSDNNAPTYSAPVQKLSDQLPAQLTEEEPPEQTPTSSAIQEKVQEEDGPPEQLLEEDTAPNRRASPVKPTPPHRMGQEEKNAHLARLMADKEKPVSAPSPIHPSSAPPAQHVPSHHHMIKPSLEVPPSSVPLQHRQGGHQDDTLAMVQSVFDTTKPRLPDTPKDKEAISKIADHLRFSAEKYETNKTPDASRRRQDSGMSHTSQGHSYPHHDPMVMERDDGRRKRQSLTRYDQQHPQLPQQSSSMRQQQQHQPPHHQQPMDAPHRSRGRPRGSTGPLRGGRFGNDPVAPHRSSGGARTLPPRQQAAPSRNSRVAEDSDSESDRIEEGWTMRCYCGMTHPTGMSLECEKCKTWQHTLCMGMNSTSNTDGYMCELCVPRQLPITKAEAIRIQKKELAKVKKLEKKEKKQRRSEPPEPPKKAVASSSRKSAPMAYQPPEKKLPQLNDYSKAAIVLLSALPQTQGAEQLLDDARQHTRAKRMYVSENVEALVTTEIISARSVLIEMNGYISMLNEVKRQPGGGGHIFLYDGLMKGASGEDTGDTQELIVVDTRKKGNDTKLTRRSCQPNCVLKHVLGEQVTLGVMLVATREIPYNQEVTLPFDLDWLQSEVPLECSDHIHNPSLCPFESQRQRNHALRGYQRRQEEEEKRRKKEEEKAILEEKRRLEEEVRRERKLQMKLMDEAEEKKKQEERAAYEAKKKLEREEAKKKREAEKAARQASTDVGAEEDEAKSETQPTSSTRSTETPHKLTRDERYVQNIEEQFRRQEEEMKRKEAIKAKAHEKTASKDRKSMSKTPDSKSGQPGTSEGTEGTSESSNAPRSASVSHKRPSRQSTNSMSVDDTVEGLETETPRRGKRHESVKTERTASPPAKRPRASTVRETSSAKRQNTPKLAGPAAKKSKTDAPRLSVKDLKEALHSNAMKVIEEERYEFVLPISISGIEISDWVKAKVKNHVDGTNNVAKEKHSKFKKKSDVRESSLETPKEKRNRASVEVKREKSTSVVEHEQEKRKEVKREVLSKSPEPVEEPNPSPIPNSAPKVNAEVDTKEEPVASTPIPVEVKQEPREPTPAMEETPAEVKNETAVKESKESSESKEVHQESREGSEAKDSIPKKGGVGPKKLSIEQYKQKRASNKDESASGTPSTSGPPRQCFIPSTDASSTANATLSNILFPETTPTPNGPSTSGAPNSVKPREIKEEPVAHTQSLADRAASVFGLIPGLQPSTSRQPSSTSSSSSAQRPHDTRAKQRPSRWN